MATQQSTRSVEQFMDDPITFFGESLTQMHGIARDELEELQRQAMAIRFQQHLQSIEMVRKLADRLGVTEINEFNDIVPLMFSHTAFKSYPAALIDNKRFDLMTKWLDKLTSHDLSGVETDSCNSIDEWIDRLRRTDPARGHHLQRHHRHPVDHPEDKHGAREGMVLWKICLFQTFGKEPTEEELNPAVDAIWPISPRASSATCESPT